MNPITNALTQGFSYDNVMQYLLRHFPHARKQIETALARGFSADKIVKFLQGGRNEVNAPVTEHEKTRHSDVKKQRELEKNIGKGAVLAGGALLGGRAIQAGVGALGQMLPQGSPNPTNLQVPLTSALPKTTPLPQTSSINPSPAPQIAPNVQAQAQAPVSQAMQPNQAKMPIPPAQQAQPDLGSILEQAGIKEQVDGMRARNPPELIAKVLRGRLGKNSQALESMAQMPLEQVISEYVKTAPALPTYEEKISKAVPFKGEKPTPPTEPEIKENPRALDIQISRAGKLSPISEKTEKTAFGQERPRALGDYRRLSDITYEQKYKDLNPKERESFNIIDNAIDKTAAFMVQGKTFKDLLPQHYEDIKSGKKNVGEWQMSTAEDVLRLLAGVPSKYNLLSPEEQEETFNTFQGITPNVVWNTISMIDPRIQKVQRPTSPKGSKNGKAEMTPNDFRRFLAHSVIGLMEKHKDFGPRAKMVTSVINMINKFDMRKSTSDIFPELQNLSDEEINRMLSNVPEEEVKKLR